MVSTFHVPYKHPLDWQNMIEGQGLPLELSKQLRQYCVLNSLLFNITTDRLNYLFSVLVSLEISLWTCFLPCVFLFSEAKTTWEGRCSAWRRIIPKNIDSFLLRSFSLQVRFKPTNLRELRLELLLLLFSYSVSLLDLRLLLSTSVLVMGRKAL